MIIEKTIGFHLILGTQVEPTERISCVIYDLSCDVHYIQCAVVEGSD